MPQATLTKPEIASGGLAQAAGHDADAWKKKNLLQLFNISIGFLGIQFAWAIQMGQMSPLLESLGSDPRLTGLIWCAGPVTGVLVQPIIGQLSDRCGIKMGRRRPFLLLGAVLTAIALVAMPNSPSLLMAAVLLWVLDAAINITQGPYRALVPDVVHKTQQASAYSLMSLTIGLGSVAAFMIGYAINNMHNLFYLGAMAMMVAMCWTVISTPEPNPASLKEKDEAESGENFFAAMFRSITSMPKEGLKLCIAHSFTWFGLMCLFVFFSLYVPHHVFGAESGTPAYQEGVQWASLCYAVLNTVCFIFSAFIGRLCDATSKKAVHTFGLLCMGLSFLSMFFIADQYWTMAAMGLIGIGWATTLSIPFALLSDHLPSGKEGVMMGTFNIFIAAPGVISNLLVGQIVSMYGDNVTIALLIGGVAVLASMLLLQAVTEGKTQPDPSKIIVEESALPA